MTAKIMDHTTQANWTQCRVTHNSFDLVVDFDAQVFRGVATINAVAVEDGVTDLVLDTKALTIKSVTTGDGNELEYVLSDAHAVLGSALKIKLAGGALTKGSSTVVKVSFVTAQDPMAAKFLAAAQTADRVAPYMFTQCQAIHARTLVPCQDTPAVKSSYDARVRVPAGLTALMSAVSCDSAGPAAEEEGMVTFAFEQKVPIPAYLLAIVVGKLESRELGPRTRVWSEPSMVDACAYEFAETPRFVEIGESLCGDYVWGRYDLLVLPPAFPYGGMENPCLTFITPTLIARDRSLTSTVAHEVAHSWSGNLVTNGNWEDFWLNEGWTRFIERKILGRLHGEAALQFAAALGHTEMMDAIRLFGADHNFTKLVPDLSDGKDPDDAFSRIPYEKGFHFLYYLQSCAGGPSAFEPFMKRYFAAFANGTVTSELFRSFYLGSFGELPAVKAIEWDKWLHAPGEPPEQNTYDVSLGEAAYALAKKWHTSDITGLGSSGPDDAGPDDMEGWSTQQKMAFLNKLLEYRSLTGFHPSVTRRMNELYGLDGSHNGEIQCLWYQICIGAEDDVGIKLAADFVRAHGRMKYLRPIYRALHRSKGGRDLALATFQEVEQSYHPIAAKMVAVDLKLTR